MSATNRQGHAWTGERDGEWWNYRDDSGNEYQSREIPAFRIRMDNATQTTVNGRRTITPLDSAKATS